MTPFSAHCAFALDSGNRVTIEVNANRDRLAEDPATSFNDIQVEFHFQQTPNKADEAEARLKLREVAGETSMPVIALEEAAKRKRR